MGNTNQEKKLKIPNGTPEAVSRRGQTVQLFERIRLKRQTMVILRFSLTFMYHLKTAKDCTMRTPPPEKNQLWHQVLWNGKQLKYLCQIQRDSYPNNIFRCSDWRKHVRIFNSIVFITTNKQLIWFDLILIVFNATFSNISAIWWRQVFVVEEAGVPGENHRPWAKNL